MLLLNRFLFRNIASKSVTPTDYNTFISMVEKGEVKEVNIKQDHIFFSSEMETQSKGDGKQQVQIYQTGKLDDPELVNRLLSAEGQNEEGKISFTEVIPKQSSPMTNLLLYWILPGLLLYWGATYMIRTMGRRRELAAALCRLGRTRRRSMPRTR